MNSVGIAGAAENAGIDPKAGSDGNAGVFDAGALGVCGSQPETTGGKSDDDSTEAAKGAA